VHRQVLLDVLGYAAGAGWQARGLIASLLLGLKGNREFLVWLQPGEAAGNELEPLIQGVLA
jgi:predicted rRNA methylase YqxC with S4 and FtsJ domains